MHLKGTKQLRKLLPGRATDSRKDQGPPLEFAGWRQVLAHA